jgi:hypothetical protein
LRHENPVEIYRETSEPIGILDFERSIPNGPPEKLFYDAGNHLENDRLYFCATPEGGLNLYEPIFPGPDTRSDKELVGGGQGDGTEYGAFGVSFIVIQFHPVEMSVREKKSGDLDRGIG